MNYDIDEQSSKSSLVRSSRPFQMFTYVVSYSVRSVLDLARESSSFFKPIYGQKDCQFSSSLAQLDRAAPNCSLDRSTKLSRPEIDNRESKHFRVLFFNSEGLITAIEAENCFRIFYFFSRSCIGILCWQENE